MSWVDSLAHLWERNSDYAMFREIQKQAGMHAGNCPFSERIPRACSCYLTWGYPFEEIGDVSHAGQQPSAPVP